MYFISNRALTEGWDLFEVDGRLQIQRLDNPASITWLDYTEPKFEGDDEALAFVHRKVVIGSEYHRQALSLVGASSKELR